MEATDSTEVRIFSSPLSVEACLARFPEPTSARRNQPPPRRLHRAEISQWRRSPQASLQLLGSIGVSDLRPPVELWDLRFRADGDEALIVATRSPFRWVNRIIPNLIAHGIAMFPMLVIGIATQQTSDSARRVALVLQLTIWAVLQLVFTLRSRRDARDAEIDDRLGEVIWEAFEADERPDLRARALDGLEPAWTLPRGWKGAAIAWGVVAVAPVLLGVMIVNADGILAALGAAGIVAAPLVVIAVGIGAGAAGKSARLPLSDHQQTLLVWVIDRASAAAIVFIGIATIGWPLAR